MRDRPKVPASSDAAVCTGRTGATNEAQTGISKLIFRVV